MGHSVCTIYIIKKVPNVFLIPLKIDVKIEKKTLLKNIKVENQVAPIIASDKYNINILCLIKGTKNYVCTADGWIVPCIILKKVFGQSSSIQEIL